MLYNANQIDIWALLPIGGGLVRNDGSFFMSKYITKTVKLDGFIAKEKNKLLKEMLASDSDYFFLVEENCKVLDSAVYEKFIETSKKTGIEALMWPRRELNERINFNDDPNIEYFTNFTPSFNMFTRNVVEKVGFMDEKMPENTYQELEYVKRIGDAGLSTPFGMFVSPRDIDKYFQIEKPPDGYKNLKQMNEALAYWEGQSNEDFPLKVEEKPEVFEMI